MTWVRLASILCCVAWGAIAALEAEEPLHQRIDELIAQRAQAGGLELQPASDDFEFVRRVYLDLAGRIPTSTETTRFVSSNAADKRQKLIGDLLAGHEFPLRMAEMFHVMLMERRGQDEEWNKFLRHACAQNMPWDAMVRSIIKPDAENEDLRGAAYFMTARLVSEGAMAEVDVPGLTRDVGRLFAGIDLQCAQCHDHIDIDAYRQRDFQGLHMIFENVQTRRDTKFPAVAEKLMTERKEYMSVFVQQPELTGPVVPGGGEIEIAIFEAEDAYLIPPDKKKRLPGVPKFSPLGELAKELTSRDNKLFAVNIVNRIWHALMGRGLVEPLDLLHADNPPSHPKLLKLMASEFAAHDFDINWLVGELVQTSTYQRTSRFEKPAKPRAAAQFTVAHQRRVSAEQLFRSVLVATGELERRGLSWTSPSERKTLLSEDEELRKLSELFVKTYANPAREPEVEITPTVKGALFLMHEERVKTLLDARDGNLVDRLSNLSDDSRMIDEMFLAVLSRPPIAEDRRDVMEFFKDCSDRQTGIRQVVWALLSSTEFCVNH